jgi:hypothetical protein
MHSRGSSTWSHLGSTYANALCHFLSVRITEILGRNVRNIFRYRLRVDLHNSVSPLTLVNASSSVSYSSRTCRYAHTQRSAIASLMSEASAKSLLPCEAGVSCLSVFTTGSQAEYARQPSHGRIEDVWNDGLKGTNVMTVSILYSCLTQTKRG